MHTRASGQPRFATRWTYGVLAIFALLGTGLGSWLSRLPAVRDHLGASTFEMSLIGLTLATGSVIGLVLSGRTVSLLGARRSLAIFIVTQSVLMPLAATLFWVGAVIPGAIAIALFGFSFATADVAMNVSGAGAERALRKPRMSLFHAGYSLGSVTSMGLGALAESAGMSVPVHLGIVYFVVIVGGLIALRVLPHGVELDHASPAAEAEAAKAHPSVHTGPIEIIKAPAADPESQHADPSAPGKGKRAYNPWRDPRIIMIGLITMSMSLAEGTASDWLPLALADGRGFANDTAALTLAIFFVSMTLVRIAGSWLLPRFGRVTVLRAGAVLVAVGVGITILVPSPAASVIGAALWGMGCAFGFPVGISAAADDPKTAVRGVAAVSAIAYTAFLLGPMLIGFLGEQLGLLPAFWPLVIFAAFVLVVAGVARERPQEPSTPAR
ncbi:MFS transporter [Leucobacter salsicius]|uniref:MFS transporter n=1 Tax=Leucobacter salsicius TaxID=664638 RepID=UPI00037F238C|nr:MFS transporter [Leucobacter salsicius]